MSFLSIVNQLNLQTGDRLIRRKGPLSRHHGIFVENFDGTALVAENQAGNGVQYVSLEDFLQGSSANLVNIVRFPGTEEARQHVIMRINALIGVQYDLVNFNCEHFAELIQSGVATSLQVKNTLLGLAVLGLGIWALSSQRNR